MPPALRKPKHGHQPRGYLASPAIAVHLVKESAVADSAGIAWPNERGGTDTRRVGVADLVHDGTAPPHFLIALVSVGASRCGGHRQWRRRTTSTSHCGTSS